jgi:hypothetical protein
VWAASRAPQLQTRSALIPYPKPRAASAFAGSTSSQICSAHPPPPVHPQTLQHPTNPLSTTFSNLNKLSCFCTCAGSTSSQICSAHPPPPLHPQTLQHPTNPLSTAFSNLNKLSCFCTCAGTTSSQICPAHPLPRCTPKPCSPSQAKTWPLCFQWA